MFSLAFAELFQLKLRRTAGYVDFGSVVPLAAVFTLKPDVFSFFSLGHFLSA
jgi:hypothetical protein